MLRRGRSRHRLSTQPPTRGRGVLRRARCSGDCLRGGARRRARLEPPRTAWPNIELGVPARPRASLPPRLGEQGRHHRRRGAAGHARADRARHADRLLAARPARAPPPRRRCASCSPTPAACAITGRRTSTRTRPAVPIIQRHYPDRAVDPGAVHRRPAGRRAGRPTVNYSSFGYSLASMVMEAAAGQDFLALIAEEIAGPFASALAGGGRSPRDRPRTA